MICDVMEFLMFGYSFETALDTVVVPTIQLSVCQNSTVKMKRHIKIFSLQLVNMH